MSTDASNPNANDAHDGAKPSTEAPKPAAWLSGDSMSIVLCTIKPGQGEALAGTLVRERLAACVNLVPGIRSIYRWKGEISNDPEQLMMIKTSTERLDELTTRMLELHPYDLPELINVTPNAVGAAYMSWLLSSVDEADELH